MKKIAFATCNEFPFLTDDDKLPMPHLAEKGIKVAPIIWDESTNNYDDFDVIVIRSVWDYHKRYNEFINWLDRLNKQGMQILNSYELIKWNSNKKYLLDLKNKGIKIPGTFIIDKGSSAELTDIMIKSEWDKVVVKPAVSASAFETWCVSLNEAENYNIKLNDLLSSRNIIIQEYVEEITTEGEWSILFFNGKFSHAVKKLPKDGDFRVQEEYGGSIALIKPADYLIEQAENVIQQLDETPLYTRVDGIDINNQFVLLELELIEPDLFFRLNDEIPKRFAKELTYMLNN